MVSVGEGESDSEGQKLLCGMEGTCGGEIWCVRLVDGNGLGGWDAMDMMGSVPTRGETGLYDRIGSWWC